MQLMTDEIVVDLFCGGGGATQGIENAGLVVHECVNHAPLAIATHFANHPATNHRCGDVWSNEPAGVAAGRPVGLLWASPDCRHFSRARGAAPVSRRVRDLAWVVTNWAKAGKAKPRVIMVENVPEFREWGPIRRKRDTAGRVVRDGQRRIVWEPDPAKKGQTFKKWVNMLKRAGYAVEWRVLDAADFGAASRRKRLYVIARCDGEAIKWPEVIDAGKRDNSETQAACGEFGTRGRFRHHQRCDRSSRRSDQGGVQRRSAADVIDWSDLGTSVFEQRKGKPQGLAPKTLGRIAEGVRRFVVDRQEPYVLRVTQTGEGRGWKVWPVSEPMATQTTRQDLAVMTPVVTLFRGTRTGYSPADVLPTITAGNGPGRGGGAAHALGVATPILSSFYSQGGNASDLREPLPVVTTRDRHAIVTPVVTVCAHGDGKDGTQRWGRGSLPVDDPLNSIHAGGNNFAVASPVLAHLNHGAVQSSSVEQPLRTVVASGGHHALATPILATTGYGEREGQAPRCGSVEQPLNTCVDGIKQAVATPIVAPTIMHNTTQHPGSSMDSPLPTVTTGGQSGLAATVLNESGRCDAIDVERAKQACRMLVTCWTNAKEGMPTGVRVVDGLLHVSIASSWYVVVDVLFRMLRPPELAAAMGFPDHYKWPKTQRDAVRLISNAVSPPQAEALVRANFPGGMQKRERVA